MARDANVAPKWVAQCTETHLASPETKLSPTTCVVQFVKISTHDVVCQKLVYAPQAHAWDTSRRKTCVCTTLSIFWGGLKTEEREYWKCVCVFNTSACSRDCKTDEFITNAILEHSRRQSSCTHHKSVRGRSFTTGDAVCHVPHCGVHRRRT